MFAARLQMTLQVINHVSQTYNRTLFTLELKILGFVLRGDDTQIPYVLFSAS